MRMSFFCDPSIDQVCQEYTTLFPNKEEEMERFPSSLPVDVFSAIVFAESEAYFFTDIAGEKPMSKKGVIYILTNPSFPEYVKIGYATDIEKRLKTLNRSETIPFASAYTPPMMWTPN